MVAGVAYQFSFPVYTQEISRPGIVREVAHKIIMKLDVVMSEENLYHQWQNKYQYMNCCFTQFDYY